MKRIGDEDGADGGAADGDQFGGLNEDAEISVLHQIAAHHAAEHHDNADDGEHDLARLAQFPDRELAARDRDRAGGQGGLISAERGLRAMQNRFDGVAGTNPGAADRDLH